jgi:hypothetical protein
MAQERKVAFGKAHGRDAFQVVYAMEYAGGYNTQNEDLSLCQCCVLDRSIRRQSGESGPLLRYMTDNKEHGAKTSSQRFLQWQY